VMLMLRLWNFLVPLGLALGIACCGKGPPPGGSAEGEVRPDAGYRAPAASAPAAADASAAADAGAAAAPNASATTEAPIGGPVRLSMSEGGLCGIWADGSARCWGKSTPEPGGSSAAPTTQAELLPIQAVWTTALGLHHRCVLMREGIVRDAALSLQNTGCHLRYVTKVSKVEQLVMGRGGFCARLVNGEVTCWMVDSSEGGFPYVPTKVPDLRDVVEVAAGASHMCALRRNGVVWCWGQNITGQLGDGTFKGEGHPDNRKTPLPVVGLRHVKHIALGYAHSCAIVSSGDVFCWGDNWGDELGTGVKLDSQDSPGPPRKDDLNNLTARPRPGKVAALSHAVELALPGQSSCARTLDGKVYCWGGYLGSRPNRAMPSLVEGLDGVVQIVSAPNVGLVCVLL